MSDTSRPSNGLGITKLPNDMPALNTGDKAALENEVSALRRVRQKEVIDHALKTAATVQIHEIDMKGREARQQLVNDFVTRIGGETKLMMTRYTGFNNDIGDQIDQSEKDVIEAVRARGEELDRDVDSRRMSAEDAEKNLKSFADRQYAKLQREKELADFTMDTVGDLYKSSIEKANDAKRDLP